MSTLLRTFHAAFWFCVVCFAFFLVAIFSPPSSPVVDVAAYGLPGFILGGLVYASAVGLIADKYSQSGARWGIMAFVFGPIGLVGTYVRMQQLLKSEVQPSGSVVPNYSPSQKRWHWQLFIAFLVVLVVGNIVARLLR